MTGQFAKRLHEDLGTLEHETFRLNYRVFEIRTGGYWDDRKEGNSKDCETQGIAKIEDLGLDGMYDELSKLLDRVNTIRTAVYDMMVQIEDAEELFFKEA